MVLEAAIFTTCNRLDLCSAKGQDPQDKPEGREVAPLPNVRQEAFAQAVAAGKSASAAYTAAYGRAADTTSRVNGKRLLTNANVRARIGQIRDEASASAHSTLQKLFKALEDAAVRRHQLWLFAICLQESRAIFENGPQAVQNRPLNVRTKPPATLRSTLANASPSSVAPQ
ncbi:hypothetical protein C5688_03360 [Methylocystis sp. MitZ-2018]|nr:hypothetical protein C5688_03360 [Methylocystis sp. MitZ-2018]